MPKIHERFTLYYGDVLIRIKNTDFKYWIHAASVGEVKLLENIPNIPWDNTIVTCTTISGRDTVNKILPGVVAVLCPVDFVFLIKRFIKLIKPQKIIIMETELWPGLIYATRNHNVIILNGRLSDKKYTLYKKFKWFFKRIIKMIDRIYVKDKENSDRFIEFGASKDKVEILGNLKFNYFLPDIKNDPRFLKPNHKILMLGSTHAGEEKILIGIYKKLKKQIGELSVIISPRHLERLGEVKEILNEENLEYRLWSEITSSIMPGDIIVVDTIGELSKIYSLASVSFVGGSIVKNGGHNIIEPAIWGRPVVVGSNNDNFKDIIDIFTAGKGVVISKDKDELYDDLKNLLQDEILCRKMGDDNIEIIKREREKVRGVLKKI